MKLIEKFKLVYRALQYQNKYDKGGIAYINSSIKRGQTVMDIGAHKAGYLYFILKNVTATGFVYAFEPQSILFNYISNLKKILNWQNVSIEHLALSDAAGKVTLYIPSHSQKTNMSSPGATIFKDAATGSIQSTEEVNTETLDAYCKRKNIQPDFLKIDVEGNELRIFKGGIETLTKYKPKIIVEIEARHVGEQQVLDTFSFLLHLGYSGKFIHGVVYKSIDEFSFAVHQNRSDMKNYCNNFIFE